MGGLSTSHRPLPLRREAKVGVRVKVGPWLLQARLRAGLHLQPPLVPAPALAAGTRLGAGVAVPVEDGFAFAAPERNRGKTKKKIFKQSNKTPHPVGNIREERMSFSPPNRTWGRFLVFVSSNAC